MRIQLDIDGNAEENVVIIRCREVNSTIEKIEQSIKQILQKSDTVFYKGNTEYFLPMDSILFFETSDSLIDAHTADDVYKVKSKLYQLEEMLPSCFVRVSKSTILNINMIYSIEKHVTSFSTVTFNKTHKQVFVSRSYYKSLKQRLDERNRILI